MQLILSEENNKLGLNLSHNPRPAKGVSVRSIRIP